MPERVTTRGDTTTIELCYPRQQPVKYIEVELTDVRAADSLRLSYDFDRDGWVIEQSSLFEWDSDDEECDSDWQEVAFVQAWARLREEGKDAQKRP